MQHDLQEKLSAPFEDSDIEWRLQYANEEKGVGVAVPYVTNRAIQQRLDQAVGAGGWKNEYIPWHSDGKKQSQLCGISIYFEGRSEWITKYDGAEDSDIESVKGGLSDSMKRAAVQWGVGRYLYSMDTVFVDIEKSGKSTVIKKSSQPRLDEAHRRTVKKVFGANVPEQKPPQELARPQSQGQPQQQTPQPPKQAQAPQRGQQPPEKALQEPKAPQPDQKPRQGQPSQRQDQQHPNPEQQKQGQTTRTQPPPALLQTPGIPDNSYCVIDATRKPALSGVNTLMQLRSADGKAILAYMQGADPSIGKGVWLDNAVITKKVNEGVIFYTLDSFDIRVPQIEHNTEAGRAPIAA